ncbi:MAG: MmcQ/YjbR family DNA-binding protein [Bacilli bacterium]|nr:MmcQ/YjbR family DNA-binding protein [Bacilli bacterium]
MNEIERKIFSGLRFKGGEALFEAGFENIDGSFVLKTNLEGFPFVAEITCDKEGNIDGKLIDPDLNEEYIPYRLSTAKGYALEVREAYKELLRSLKDKLFAKEDELFAQRKRLQEKLYERYGHTPIVKWDDAPDYEILQHNSNAKWYALFMIIDRQKLDEVEGKASVVNIKLDPNEIDWLVSRPGYYRAYHMNKKYWITILLNGSLPDDEVLDHIARSYELTAKKGK